MAQSILPPDVRGHVRPGRSGGIGSNVRENQQAAQARDAAVDPQGAKSVAEAPPPVAETPSEESASCRNPRCGIDVKAAWEFCPSCGGSLTRGGAASQLGIKFTEEDLEEYLFRGYIIREVRLLGKHKATVKSAQPKDMRAIDEFIMNGAWARNTDGSERKVSDFYLRQMNAMCITAACIVKVDGQGVGETLLDRMNWIEERGAALVDIAANKVALFNQAITEFLTETDNISGS